MDVLYQTSPARPMTISPVNSHVQRAMNAIYTISLSLPLSTFYSSCHSNEYLRRHGILSRDAATVVT